MADNETEETKPAEEATAAAESAASNTSEPASDSKSDGSNATEPTSTNSGEAAGEEASEESMTPDQSFAYWLTMLPFIGIAIVFLFEFSKNTGDMNKLINAGGVLIVGIFAASFVNAMTSEKKDDGAMDDAKPEGSS